ncbi:hypothetical protein PILCRDRAFT_89710 [Piloderma croceum F 1598]|uniref:FHA domain-containing protein n=1 Tax=Piloderma croceum (strain F 1598) TaxID=765440 RepID=A0A0C3FLS4_PILCF|nr:hypothetical protein PILCRDRAFT_89710 [Piloderma croceum F 1598]
MTSPAGAIAITLKPAINSATFETRRLVILHDRPIWLGRADPSLNRSPTADNGWFSSPVLDEKNAMIYMCWNEVWVANLHPQNITRINSVKLSQPEALAVGDIIRLGVPVDWDAVSPLVPQPIYAEVAAIMRF